MTAVECVSADTQLATDLSIFISIFLTSHSQMCRQTQPVCLFSHENFFFSLFIMFHKSKFLGCFLLESDLAVYPQQHRSRNNFTLWPELCCEHRHRKQLSVIVKLKRGISLFHKLDVRNISFTFISLRQDDMLKMCLQLNYYPILDLI